MVLVIFRKFTEPEDKSVPYGFYLLVRELDGFIVRQPDGLVIAEAYLISKERRCIFQRMLQHGDAACRPPALGSDCILLRYFGAIAGDAGLEGVQ